MIRQLEIDGIHAKVDQELKKYIDKKIGQLDHYVQRQARDSLRADVKVKETKVKERKEYTLEVILHLPGERLTASSTNKNVFAAVDVVEAKMKTQLKKYKDKRISPKHGHKDRRVRRLLGKIIPK